MNINPRSISLVFLTAGILLNASIASGQTWIDDVRSKYNDRLAQAKKVRDAAFENDKKIAQEEAKKAFDPMIRSAAMKNQRNEVRDRTNQLNAILNPPDSTDAQPQLVSGPGAASPATRPVSAPTPVRTPTPNPTATDFELLVGKWITNNGNSTMIFEIKSNRQVVCTHNIISINGHNGNFSYTYRATIKSDKILIENSPAPMPGGSKSWYEISIPFDPNALVILHRSQSSGHDSTFTYNVKRSAQ